jgi:hypothetical protein
VSRKDHVRALGTVLEQVTSGDDFDSPTYSVDVRGQDGDHRSGIRRYVYPRTIKARLTLKMRNHHATPRVGDVVVVLVSPAPEERQTYCIIAIDSSSRQMRRAEGR